MSLRAPLDPTSSPAELRDGVGIAVWSFREGTGMQRSSVAELSAGLLDEGIVTWVDVTGAGGSLDALTHQLDLRGSGNRSTTRAAGPRPSLEALSDHALARVIVPRLAGQSLTLTEVEVVVTDRFLISRHEQPLPFGDRLDERAAQHPNLIAEDSAYLLFILLDEWLHEVETVTEELDEQIEDMEERAIVDTSRSFLKDIVALKELGFDLYQAIDRHHAVFDATLNPDFPFVAGATVENHYRDLSQRFERRVAALSDGRAAINNAINIFSSSTAQRTNRIITLLTIISTVLMPMTAIFAFYGTNFEEPPLFTMRQFVLMWAVVLTTTVPIVVMLVRRGWLRQM